MTEDVTLWANFMIKKLKDICHQMKELETTMKNGLERAKHKKNRQLTLVDAKKSNRPVEEDYLGPVPPVFRS